MFLSREVKFYGLRNSVKKYGYSPLLVALFLSLMLVIISFLGAWGYRNTVAMDYDNSGEIINQAAFLLLLGAVLVSYLSVGLGVPLLYGIRRGWRQGVKVILYQMLFLMLLIAIFANYFVHHVPASTTPFDGNLCGSGPLKGCD